MKARVAGWIRSLARPLLQLFHEQELEAQHGREIDQAREVSLGVDLANVDSIVDISLINDAAEKTSPISFLQPLDPFHGILTAEEHVELGLLRQPLVELVDDAVDPVGKPLSHIFSASSSHQPKHRSARATIERQAIVTRIPSQLTARSPAWTILRALRSQDF